jgi:hypothetical protein
MRAGLLSEQSVIDLINRNLVSTWVLIDDLKQHAGKDDEFAQSLASHWEYPLDLMFLTAEGRFVTKLNSFRDLPVDHPDVHHRTPYSPFGRSHTDIFLEHARQFLETKKDAANRDRH